MNGTSWVDLNACFWGKIDSNNYDDDSEDTFRDFSDCDSEHYFRQLLIWYKLRNGTYLKFIKVSFFKHLPLRQLNDVDTNDTHLKFIKSLDFTIQTLLKNYPNIINIIN